MNELVAMLSPISAEARPVASRMSRSDCADGSIERVAHRSGFEIDVGVDDETCASAAGRH